MNDEHIATQIGKQIDSERLNIYILGFACLIIGIGLILSFETILMILGFIIIGVIFLMTLIDIKEYKQQVDVIENTKSWKEVWTGNDLIENLDLTDRKEKVIVKTMVDGFQGEAHFKKKYSAFSPLTIEYTNPTKSEKLSKERYAKEHNIASIKGKCGACDSINPISSDWCMNCGTKL